MSHRRYIDVLGAGGVADPGLLGGKRSISLSARESRTLRSSRFCHHARRFLTRSRRYGLALALETLDSLLAESDDMTATAEQIRQSILSRRIL